MTRITSLVSSVLLAACASASPQLTGHQAEMMARCDRGDALACSAITTSLPRTEANRVFVTRAVERACVVGGPLYCMTSTDAARFLGDVALFERLRPLACDGAVPAWGSREECHADWGALAIRASRYGAAARIYDAGDRARAGSLMAALCGEGMRDACSWQEQRVQLEAAERERARAEADEAARLAAIEAERPKREAALKAQAQDRARRYAEARQACDGGDDEACARVYFFERGKDPQADTAEFEALLAKLRAFK